MPKQDRKKKTQRSKRSQDWEALPPLNKNAAGIDVGNAEHYVAVPVGRNPEPVQEFGSFTADSHRMARWLKVCGIRTVAMQATGVYRIARIRYRKTIGRR
jgi:transposase